MTPLVLFALWMATGSLGFVFWWTKDHDLTTAQLVFSVLAGLIGPFSWLLGFLIHGENKAIIKRRKD